MLNNFPGQKRIMTLALVVARKFSIKNFGVTTWVSSWRDKI